MDANIKVQSKGQRRIVIGIAELHYRTTSRLKDTMSRLKDMILRLREHSRTISARLVSSHLRLRTSQRVDPDRLSSQTMDYVVDTSLWPAKCSVDSTPPFRYSELESGETQIRLVNILCTGDRFDPGTPLELELSHAKLEDKPHYYALSYTWGSPGDGFPAEWDDPNFTFPVYINKCVLYIRPNLYSALLELRINLKEGVCMWIDAICINQNNVAEKNAQVQNMASIYSQSVMTLAWLGPADSSFSLMALRKLNATAESWNRLPKSIRQRPVPDEHVDQYSEFVESEFGREDSLELWQSVAGFLQRHWFSRAWVVQEVCCAPDVFIFSNAEYITFSELEDVSFSIAHLVLCLEQARSKDGVVNSELIYTLQREMAPLQDLMMSKVLYKSHRVHGNLPDLPDILNRLRGTNASDCRDKVYAARSLSNLELNVDYNKTTEEVFIETALAILETPDGLSLLGQCYHSVGNRLSLPSWVPDWTKSRTEDYFLLPKKGIGVEVSFYSAGGQDCRSEAQYDPAKRILKIEAFLLDNFEFVATDLCDAEVASPPPRSAKLSEWITWKRKQFDNDKQRQELVFWGLKWLHEWAIHRTAREQLDGEILLDLDSWEHDLKAGPGQDLLPIYQPTKESFQNAYERTLLCDMGIDAMNREQRLSKHVASLDLEPGLRLPGRVFACSRLGYFALVPRGTAIGDRIAIVQGYDVPIVVREKGEGFQLIGECYVHGIMDGELTEDKERFGWLPLI